MMNFLSFAATYFPYVARGIVVTVELTLLSLAGSLALGLLGALAKGSKRRWMAVIAVAYVEVLRGTPALLQIFVIYFGLASYGVRLEPLPAAAITLSILGGAYVTEII